MFIKSFFLTILFSSLLFAKNFTVSYDPDYAPFSYSIDNKPYGLLIDIWKLWAKKGNNNITFIEAKDWDTALTLAKEKKVDFFLGTTPHESWMKSSQTYYKTKTALYTLKTFQNKIKSIGIIGDDYKGTLHKQLPDIKIISYEEYNSLLNALSKRKVDAIYDDMLAISYYAIKNKYQHLIKTSYTLSEASDVKAISATIKNIQIFNTNFKKISLKELESIESNWVSDKNIRYYNNATFLKKREFNYVYDPDWKPFEYKDKMNHQHMGIIADLLSLVSSKSGLIFHAVSTNTWAESVALLKAKKVDMVSAVPITPKRKKYLNFSKKSIYSYPAVLVCNKNRDFTLNTTMNNKRIGIIKGNSLGEWIKKRYPLAHFIYFSKLKNAFNALQNNTIDFFGINGVTATYYINVVGYHESKIYTILPYMFHLKIALLKNVDPVVLTLIDEALSQITQKEFSDIYHKWTSVEIKKETNWKIVLSIIAIAMLIVLIFLFINKKLNRLVQKRTAELKELNENLEKKVEIRTEELALINQKMQENIRYASLIQNSILPQEKELKSFFQDSFILWEPKDIVGGDIYFFQQLNEDEALLFIVDCTGHGVSGAFVTMLVKAMQEQLLLVFENKDLKPNTILEYFEKTFQKLLRQKNTNTNVGFDAAVLYCNKATKKILFSGANIALYYTLHNQIFTKKPSRHTIGYNTSQETYSYKKMEIQFEDNMTFYLTTDGYIDQNGGNKGFPFGKQRFFSLLEQSSHTPLNKQKQLFMETLQSYQKDEERNDDITVIAFKF